MVDRSFIDLLVYKTRANLRAELSRLYLNYAWWALEPLFSMAIFYVVFGIFMNSPTPHFALFLLIGTTQWQWFNSTVLHAAPSILNAAGLMKQVNIHKIFFPLEVFLQDCFKHLFVLVLMTLFIFVYPVPFSWSWVSLPLLFLLQGILVLACALLAAALVPFFPDLRLILATFLHALFFASGIFFDVERFILPEHRSFLYLNPIAGLIREYRNVIIDGDWPDLFYCINVALFSLFILACALHMLCRYNKLYPRLCQE